MKKDLSHITKEFLAEEHHVKDRTIKEIAKDVGVCKETLYKIMDRFGVEKRSNGHRNINNLKGKRYGYVEVQNFISGTKKNTYWLCKCDCGKIFRSDRRNLKAEKVHSCGCRGKYGGEVPGYLYSWIAKSARKMNREFSVSYSYLCELYIKQNRLCAISGLPIVFVTKGDLAKGIKGTASLDRIDSKKHYIEGNVQWTHKHVNKIKLDLDLEYFKKLCETIYLYNKRK
jgi:hypothetical protein